MSFRPWDDDDTAARLSTVMTGVADASVALLLDLRDLADDAGRSRIDRHIDDEQAIRDAAATEIG